MAHVEDHLLGGAFVLLYALARFNVPNTSRSSTTAFRFYSGSAIYGLVSLLIFLILTRFQSLVPALFDGNAPPAYLASLSTPLAAALLVTALLPNTPWLSAIDKRLREGIQRLAAIPTEALRLSHRLQRSAFSPTAAQVSRATKALESKGVPMAGLDAQGRGMLAFWIKATIVFQHLDDLLGSTWAGAFLGMNGPALTNVRQRHDGTSDEVRAYLSTVRADLMAGEEVGEAIRHFGRAVSSRADDFFKQTCDLVSQAVLHCSYTERQRRQRLEEFGFRPDRDERALSFDQYVQLFLALTALLLLGSWAQVLWGHAPPLERCC